MARDKTIARKLSLLNPDSEDGPNGGDARGVVLAGLRAEDDQGPFARAPNPIAISLTGGAYTQNFDSLANTGTSGATPTDWVFSESGTAANATYSAGTGSSATGDTYSFGAASATDRAFGTLLSSSVNPILGATFTNNSGGTIASLLISYIGEMWRYGFNDSISDRLDFQISVNATSLTTGTWTDVDALDFTTPNITGAAGARDGNAAGFRTAISSTITGLSIASGATFWIRWTDFNKANADDGLAIDDFSLTPTIVHPGALSIDDVSHFEGGSGTTAYTFTVTRSGGSDGAVAATWTIGFPGGAGSANGGDLAGGQGLTGTVSFANGETSRTITVNVAGDYFIESDETFTVTLSAPTGGATISDATGIGTIANDDVAGAISIDDVSHSEGDGGTTLYTFTVSRTGQAANTSVQWALGAPGGGGNAGLTDFPTGQALSGSIAFAGGETSRTITVSVLGDHLHEPDETFSVTLSNPSAGATIADGTGIGTIVNDDDAPPFTPYGNEVTVNQNIDQDQVGPRVAWIDAGHYVVTWTSHETPTSYEVMARLFNADGTPAGDEFQVNTTSVGDQVGNRVAALSGGGFVIVWSDVTTTDIRAQMFNADGSPDGLELLLNTDPNAQSVPWVSALPGGGFAAVWMHNDGVSYDIRGRTFDADGLPAGAEFAVNTNTALNQQYAQMTTLANGHFVVVWHDAGGVGGDASGTAIKMRVFDTDGTALTDETLVNTTIAGIQQFPAVGSLAGGGYVVAWEDNSVSPDDVSGNALRAQIYDSSGHAVGSEFLVNATTYGYQARPTITGLPDGGFVIGWWNQNAGHSDNEIRAQAFDALGNRRGGEFEVNSDAAGDQLGPAFAASPVNGHLVATWNDFNDSQELTDGEIEQRLFTLPAPGALSIADLSQAEGDSGPGSFTFTVARTGGSLGTVGATWTLTLSGDADAADFTAFPQTGTVSFADGETSKTITIAVQGDTLFEPNETFAVLLSSPTGGATIADTTGQGTITNDDPLLAPAVDLSGGDPGNDYASSYAEQGAGAPIGNAIAVTQGTLPITRATVTVTDAVAGDQLIVSGTLPATIAVDPSSTATSLILVGGGSAADWAAALALVRYTHAGDNPDLFGTDLQRTIGVVVSNGLAAGAPAVATVTIAAANDAPTVGALDGDSVLWTEGDPYVLLDQNMPATVFDPDNQDFGGGFLSVGVQANPKAEDEFFVLDSAPGVHTNFNDIYVGGVHIGTITSAGPGQILTIGFTAEATAARVATLLDHIAYRNVAGDIPSAGARSVTYLLNDGHGDAAGGVVTVNVAAVNDGPIVADTFIAIDEDQIWVLSLADFDIVDPEGDAIATIMITGVTAGLIYYDADGTGAGQPEAVTVYPRTFSFGDIAAGRLSWVPEANFDRHVGDSYFQYGVTDDQGAASAGARVYFDIAPVIDAPTVDLNGTNQAGTSFGAVYVEGSAAARIADLDVAITSESGGLTGARITITDALAGDLLSVVGSLSGAITALYDPGSATLTLSGAATVAQYQTALTQIRYSSTSENPGASGSDTQRSIAIVVTDGLVEGTPSSAPAVTTVTVAGVNDVPVITIPAGTTVYAESVNTAPAAVVVNNAITIADLDDTSLASATIWIVNYQSSQDSLAFNNNNAATFGNIVAIFDNGLGVLTLLSEGGTATLAQWQSALRAVTYSNSSEEPFQVSRTVVFTVNDGDDDSAAATRGLSVTAQNDSPSGTNSTVTINEDARFTFTAAHFGFSDVDGDAFAGVRFSAAPVGGTLFFDADGSGSNPPVAITSFPTTTYAPVDIARLSFVPTANLNGAAAASVSFSVVDNGGTVGAGQNADPTPNTLTFNITSVNDAPTGADKTITLNEDASHTLTVADFGFSDVDGNAFEAVILHHPISGGTLYINGNPMTNFTLVYLHTVQSGGLVFVPAANATGAVGGLTFTVRDDGGFANGGEAADLTPNRLTFSMNAVNDAPVNIVPGAQSLDEDASLAFGTAGGNALSVADLDATELTVTLSVAHGTLTLASTAGLTFSDGAGDATMTFTGTAAAINAALGAGLTYAPAADYYGGDTLAISTSDNGGTGIGGTLIDADTVAITIAPLPDTPAIANFDADVTFVEGSAAIRIDMAGDALVTDVDTMDFAGGYLQVILQEAVPGEDVIGFATAPDTGITLSDGTNTGSIVSIGGIAIGTIVSGSPTAHSFTVNFNANADAADATTLLRAITYLNTNTDHPSTLTRAIVVFVNDGDEGGQAGAVSNVHITRVNDAPTNIVPGGQTIEEDASLTLSTADGNAISVADVDASTLTVTLSVAHGALTLASTAGLSFSGGSDGAADATMTFSGTAAAINAALGAGLTYVPDANFNGADAISVVTTDGGQTGTGPVGTDSDSIAVSIAAINDAPAGANATITLNEDGSRTLTQADFGFSDPVEGHGFAGVVITTLPTNGTLLLNGAALLAAETFVSAAELAAGQLVFQPDADANGAAYAALTFQVRDTGGGQDTDQSPDTLTFAVSAINDSPAVDLNGAGPGTSATLNYAENGAATAIAPVGAVIDVDTTDFGGGSLWVTITNGLNAEDVLSILNQGNGTGQVGYANGLISYEGVTIADLLPTPGFPVPVLDIRFRSNVTVSPAAVDAVLRAVAYHNVSQDPAMAPRTVTFSFNDGDGNPAGGDPPGTATAIIGVVAINDAPSGTGATIAIDEDGSRVLTQADFGFSDPAEGDAFAGVLLSSLPANGILLLNGVAVTVAGTFVTAAQLAAGQLVFAPGPDGNGAGYASFNFAVRDDGGTINGGLDTDQSPNTLTFDVTAINDAPAGTSSTIAMNEDTGRILTAADFGFSDTADGNAFAGVVLTSLPTAGFLIYDPDGAGGLPGVFANVGRFITAAELALGALTYYPPSHASGAALASFTFQVRDNGGTANGGQDTDQAPDTITFTVNPVNDAPSGADKSVIGSEDDPYVFTAADFGFTDPVEGDAFFAIRIATLPGAGDILLNGVAVMAGDVIAVSAIDAGLLTFQPDADTSGAPYASFTFQVQDDGGTANGGVDMDQTPNTITIAIAPDNLAPVLDLDSGAAGVDAALSYTENNPATAIAPAATLTDDSADFAGGTITAHFAANGTAQDQLSILSAGGIAVSPTDDTLFYGGVLIGSWGGGANGADLVVQLNGSATAAAVEAVLRAIAYSNFSDNPALPARTIDVAVTDGDGGAASAQVTVNLVAVDDAAVARDDGFTLDEAGALAGSVFADHGAGADADVDGPALAVAAVNGSSAHVGQQILLASGALLRLNADGSFTYATNHAFDATPTGASGASNTPAFDHFTYTLAGGGTATVTLTIAGLDSDDILHGTAGNDVLLAGIGDDELNGGAGNDILYGQGGADIARGGTGDDVYIVDAMGDVTEEAAGAGNDTIVTTLSYILSSLQEIETLTTQAHAGTDDVFLTGNQYDNTLIGNAGDNLLNGVDGADVMYGLAGDDTYAIDDLGDLVIDLENQGNDIVFTYLSHTLTNGNEIETLSTVFHQGTTAINLGGSDYDNTLIGNYGANYINGNGGADTMIGLNGNDTYVADNAGDQVVEGAGGGSDLLYSFVSYTLAAGQEVETISTAGQGATTALNLTGNEFAQTIIGNAGANILDGKSGNDTLYGLGGADTFAFTSALGGGNVDTLADFAAGTDKIGLDDAIFTAIGATLNANAFVIGSAAGDADDRIVYNNATGALFYDADGNGAGAAVQFATLTGAPVLTAGDFTVI